MQRMLPWWAMAAALNVTEPCSTGIGGDCFVLFYNAKSRSVRAIAGNGRSPLALSLQTVHDAGFNAQAPFDQFHPFSVTVPGAAAGWCDTVEQFGSQKMNMSEILQPAIELATQGFPVSPITAWAWGGSEAQLQKAPHGYELLMATGNAPKTGEVMRNVNLAQTFRELGAHGKQGFYQGRIAHAIVDVLRSGGGVMSLDDLEQHQSDFCTPISTTYRGIQVYEIPPPTQGIVALAALNILEGFDVRAMEHNSAAHLHHVIEALRCAFADASAVIADPQATPVPVAAMLDKQYAAQRRTLINPDRAQVDPQAGVPLGGSDTVQFCAVDGDGNACSMINSNYMGFGSHIVPQACGFSLQNRGSNFSLVPNHPNCIAPRKRPYHTIIPGMALKDGELWSAFGVMGGFMQPQGHLQVLSNMIDFDMSPQQALDAPRICLPTPTVPDTAGVVLAEEGIGLNVIQELAAMGHKLVGPVVAHERAVFGRGQIIRRNPDTGVLMAGSDGRADGCAMGW